MSQKSQCGTQTCICKNPCDSGSGSVFAKHHGEGRLPDGIAVIPSDSHTIMTRWGNSMCNKNPDRFVAGEIALAATRTFTFSSDTPSRPFTDSDLTEEGYGPVRILTPDHEPPATHTHEEVAASTTPDVTNSVIAGIHRMPSKEKRHQEPLAATHVVVESPADSSVTGGEPRDLLAMRGSSAVAHGNAPPAPAGSPVASFAYP
jgi:hypothetical protein